MLVIVHVVLACHNSFFQHSSQTSHPTKTKPTSLKYNLQTWTLCKLRAEAVEILNEVRLKIEVNEFIVQKQANITDWEPKVLWLLCHRYLRITTRFCALSILLTWNIYNLYKAQPSSMPSSSEREKHVVGYIMDKPSRNIQRSTEGNNWL